MAGSGAGPVGWWVRGYAPSPRPPRGLPHDVPGRTPRNVGRRMGGEGAPGAAARSGDARSRRWRSGPALVGSRSIPGADHLSVAVSRWHRVARILRSSGTGRYGLSFPGRPHPPSHRSAHGFAGRAVSGMTGRRRRGSWQGMRLCAASHRPPSVDRRGPPAPTPGTERVGLRQRSTRWRSRSRVGDVGANPERTP